MEISLRTNYTLAELTIKSDNTTIKEDVSTYQSEPRGYFVREDITEQLIGTARDCYSFNNKTDVESCKDIISRFLTNGELEQLIEELKEEA